ncbi:MAG: transporter substrate-binding domain-containing protein [Hydrogenibacillus sp.]|nr:transporter substrate-binding domain-containing protein [Hydrogenibacillus sp.]
MMRNIVVILGLFIIGLFGAAACGRSDVTTQSTSSDRPYIVGSDAAYAPFEYVNDKGEIVGWSIEFIHKLGELGGFQVDVKNIPWDSLFQEVKNGGIDLAISSISITDDRRKSFDLR